MPPVPDDRTRTSIHPQPSQPQTFSNNTPLTPGSEPGGHFVPGTVLVGRYRIVALLGRGGMGEVYRADDLTLAQTDLGTSVRSSRPRRHSFHECRADDDPSGVRRQPGGVGGGRIGRPHR
jgi:hypothetical protein